MTALLSIWPEIPLDTRILELGCNVGRQTYRLQTLGYTNLTRADINPHALRDTHFPHTSRALIVDLEGEDCGELEGEKFDLVFTVAVLEHIYSDRVLDKISSLATGFIAVCEDEEHTLDTHTARNYKEEFGKRGWWQVSEARVPEDRSFRARVFVPKAE
jgi:2-polyprenyl-3-methyl-5-hydroxy-6-metoxy-1,4-benzoquinol methylase